MDGSKQNEVVEQQTDESEKKIIILEMTIHDMEISLSRLHASNGELEEKCVEFEADLKLADERYKELRQAYDVTLTQRSSLEGQILGYQQRIKVLKAELGQTLGGRVRKLWAVLTHNHQD